MTAGSALQSTSSQQTDASAAQADRTQLWLHSVLCSCMKKQSTVAQLQVQVPQEQQQQQQQQHR
jgi:hypothetical protein